MMGLTDVILPKIRVESNLPFIPLEKEIDAIINGTRTKTSTFLRLLRDTGLRPIELHRLTLRKIDLDKGIIYPESAKGGNARALKLKTETLAMLRGYVTEHDFRLDEKMFPDTKALSYVFIRTRNRLAKRLCEPQLKKFRLYDLRHYYATVLYHRTKDILLVKEKWGHKRLETTLIYTHLIDFRDEEFTVRAAKSVDEATKLIESGFEYVTEMDGVKLFKKRK